MVKQKQNTYKPSEGERKTLIVCATVMIAFFLFVAITTQGSLTHYTIPHALLGLISVSVLLRPSLAPIPLVRTLIVLAVVGAVSAIGLAVAYLPYYSQYLNYVNSAK